jgi:hypothetical protein
MLYDPNGSSSLQVLFPTAAVGHGPAVPPAVGVALTSMGVPFAGDFAGNSLPVFTVASGQVRGRVFVDNDDDGFAQPGDAGVPQAVVYLDANNNGQLDLGEQTATTDANGNYLLSALLPGTYTVREVIPAGMQQLSPGASFQVSVSGGQISDGWDFGVVKSAPDEASAYVAGLYGSMLFRAPDDAGLARWSNLIRQGTPRDQVARRIWESAEHRGLEVDRYYAVYLQRAADSAGRAAWVRAFLNGASEIDVQRGFVTSGEYQANHGGDNTGFLTGLYVDILGRTPDASGQAMWLQRLQSGISRAQVAQAFLSSEEAYRQVLDLYYEDYLQRPKDDSGTRSWLSALLSKSTTLEGVGAGILASQEYLDRQHRRMGA